MTHEPTLRVLLVDDDAATVEMLGAWLRSDAAGSRFETAAARTMKEALEQVRREPFDAAVLDLNLPDSRGIETVATLRKAALPLPILVVTGVDDVHAVHEAMAQGAQDYLVKGRFDGELLSRALRHAMSLRRTERMLHEMALFPLYNPGPAMRVDEHGSVVALNPAAAQLGASAGRALAAMLPALGAVDFARCVRSGERVVREARWGTQDFQFVIQGVPEHACAQLYGADVTERRLAEEALRESEANYRRLFEDSLMGISQASPDGRLIQVNMAYARMYGYASPVEMMAEVTDIGRQLYADPEQRKDVLRVLGEEGVMEVRELPVVRRDGTRMDVMVAAREFRDASGKLLGYQATHLDVTERKQAQAALAASRQRMQALTRYLMAIREEERTRIAREIHDDLGQALSGMKMDLAMIDRALTAGGAAPDSAECRTRVRRMAEMIDGAVQTVRAIASDLRPGILDDLGLDAAIEWQARQFEERTGIRVALDLAPMPQGADNDRATAVFRIFQETLTNVMRHAQASQIHARLREREGSCVLVVSDNGRGVRPDELANPHAFGITGMKERARAVGGALDVRGDPGRGTTVTVTVPMG